MALAANGEKFKSLQEVYLANNQITDEGVKALAANGDKFQSLQRVDLSNNQITDEGLKALAANGDKFQSLQTVDLRNNKITQPIITQLKSQYNLKFSIVTWASSQYFVQDAVRAEQQPT